MTHHAYLHEGSLTDFPALAVAARNMLDFSATATPDVYEWMYDKFGIDESRELTQLASLRGVGDQSPFILGVSSITTEAQQALLKLFEEPRKGLTFVLMLQQGVILPTLRSRMMPFVQHGVLYSCITRRVVQPHAQKFLSVSSKERSEMLAKILKADDAKEQLHTLLIDVELALYTRKKADQLAALSEIAAVRPYLSDRAPSLKMIFEHLAVVLPKI